MIYSISITLKVFGGLVGQFLGMVGSFRGLVGDLTEFVGHFEVFVGHFTRMVGSFQGFVGDLTDLVGHISFLSPVKLSGASVMVEVPIYCKRAVTVTKSTLSLFRQLTLFTFRGVLFSLGGMLFFRMYLSPSQF